MKIVIIGNKIQFGFKGSGGGVALLQHVTVNVRHLLRKLNSAYRVVVNFRDQYTETVEKEVRIEMALQRHIVGMQFGLFEFFVFENGLSPVVCKVPENQHPVKAHDENGAKYEGNQSPFWQTAGRSQPKEEVNNCKPGEAQCKL